MISHQPCLLCDGKKDGCGAFHDLEPGPILDHDELVKLAAEQGWRVSIRKNKLHCLCPQCAEKEPSAEDEARTAYHTLGLLAGNVATIRDHVERMAKPTMSDLELGVWQEITGYLDAAGIKPIARRIKRIGHMTKQANGRLAR